MSIHSPSSFGDSTSATACLRRRRRLLVLEQGHYFSRQLQLAQIRRGDQGDLMLARGLSDDHRARDSWQVHDRGIHLDTVQQNNFDADTTRKNEASPSFFSSAVLEASQITRPKMHPLNEFLSILASAIAVADMSGNEA